MYSRRSPNTVYNPVAACHYMSALFLATIVNLDVLVVVSTFVSARTMARLCTIALPNPS
eukprot:jgi/Pico_ML_1/52851/g3496.t1